MSEKAEQERLWRDEFPVATADERYVNRRQLAKFLTLASLGMFAGNLWILMKSRLRKAQVYQRSVVAKAGEIPVGGVKLFQYPKPGEQCILIRTAEDVYVAYSQKCTHLSCAVFYSRAEDRLECPCHRSLYGIDGSVLRGPTTKPLKSFVNHYDGHDLLTVRIPGLTFSVTPRLVPMAGTQRLKLDFTAEADVVYELQFKQRLSDDWSSAPFAVSPEGALDQLNWSGPEGVTSFYVDRVTTRGYYAIMAGWVEV